MYRWEIIVINSWLVKSVATEHAEIGEDVIIKWHYLLLPYVSKLKNNIDCDKFNLTMQNNKQILSHSER